MQKHSVVPSVAVLAFAIAVASPSPVHAAAAYDNCTGFVDTLPAVLTTQGTWCLRGDLVTSMASGSAITIGTSNVTLDCNGFKLGGLAAGATSTARGVNAENRMNLTVRDCGIRGFYRGINIGGGGGHLVEDNRLDFNLYVGIRVTGQNNLVRGNRVFETGGYPFAESAHSILAIFVEADVIDNIVDGVLPSNGFTTAYGIFATSPSPVIRGNTVRGVDGGDFRYPVGISGAVGGRGRIEGNHVEGIGGGWGIERGYLCIGNSVTGTNVPYAECENSEGNFGVDEV